MFKKNLLVRYFLCVFSFFVASRVEAVVPKYPAIQEWQGQVWLTTKDGKRQQVRSKQVLREKALLETSASSEVKIQLDDKRSVVLFSSSVLSIPIIGWEHGETPVLILKSGDLHWFQDPNEKAGYNIALNSDLFEFIAPPGNFIYSIDPQRAFAGVKVFEGSIEFSALNGEESVLVKKGQKVGFQGVLEGGEISYDVLLKGKKIPKGTLTAVSAIDSQEITVAAKQEKKRLQKVAAKERKEKAAIAKFKREGHICENPQAKFNECAWLCLNNPKKEQKNCLVSQAKVSCVRRRCNANGDWAEETLLNSEEGSSKCKAQPVVAPCDY